jgi:hypothetical protein
MMRVVRICMIIYMRSGDRQGLAPWHRPMLVAPVGGTNGVRGGTGWGTESLKINKLVHRAKAKCWRYCNVRGLPRRRFCSPTATSTMLLRRRNLPASRECLSKGRTQTICSLLRICHGRRGNTALLRATALCRIDGWIRGMRSTWEEKRSRYGIVPAIHQAMSYFFTPPRGSRLLATCCLRVLSAGLIFLGEITRICVLVRRLPVASGPRC